MNIYISSLSFNVNDEDLKDVFSDYGEVASAKVITDKFTGKSKGFGFVEMPNTEEAKNAIKELNGAQYDGRKINVNEARPREERPQNNGRRNSGFNNYRKY
jgi:RNA recognition motif-containing protein